MTELQNVKIFYELFRNRESSVGLEPSSFSKIAVVEVDLNKRVIYDGKQKYCFYRQQVGDDTFVFRQANLSGDVTEILSQTRGEFLIFDVGKVIKSLYDNDMFVVQTKYGDVPLFKYDRSFSSEDLTKLIEVIKTNPSQENLEKAYNIQCIYLEDLDESCYKLLDACVATNDVEIVGFIWRKIVGFQIENLINVQRESIKSQKMKDLLLSYYNQQYKFCIEQIELFTNVEGYEPTSDNLEKESLEKFFKDVLSDD